MPGSGGVRHLFSDREFIALASTAFARSQTYSTILIAMALYAGLFQTSGTVEGMFGTGFALAQLGIVLPLGRLIDIGNAKRYLVAGLVLNVGVFVGFSLVGRVEHVIAMRTVQGVADSPRRPARMTLFVEEGEQFDAVAGSMSLRSIGWNI